LREDWLRRRRLCAPGKRQQCAEQGSSKVAVSHDDDQRSERITPRDALARSPAASLLLHRAVPCIRQPAVIVRSVTS
jgi:hypothetical protein